MKRFDKKYSAGLWLQVCFVCAMMVPNITILAVQQPSFWPMLIELLLPLGFFLIWGAVLYRNGIMVLLSAPFMFLAAFQLILLYLFEDAVISSDMFANLMTTSLSESVELLGNIYSVVIAIVSIYFLLIVAAVWSLMRKRRMSESARRNSLLFGTAMLCIGTIVAIALKIDGKTEFNLTSDVFPCNVVYNHLQSRRHWEMIGKYDAASSAFSFEATRISRSEKREIYVMVIGESSRAFSWSAYGYGRKTTPRLDTIRNICLFSSMLTQSNATYKSVPMMLCCINAETYNFIYGMHGIFELFSGAGFSTVFISNQSPEGAMISKLAHQADDVRYFGADGEAHLDDELLPALREVICADDDDLFVIIHTYGSNFNYNNRYPESFSHFRPDKISYLGRDNAECVVNAYDNSILYTDYVLSQIIALIDSTDACAAMMYCSDHGEDLFDDSRREFLHSSSNLSYYQLHVPCFCWMSDNYMSDFPAKAQAAIENENHLVSTAFVFHTLADMADIDSRYVKKRYSLLSRNNYSHSELHYLNDRYRAVKHRNSGINDDDLLIFMNRGMVLSK